MPLLVIHLATHVNAAHLPIRYLPALLFADHTGGGKAVVVALLR
jgi:hypothetical protein